MLEIFNEADCGDPQDVRSWLLWDPFRPHIFTITTYAEHYAIADPTTRLMNQLGVLLLAKASYDTAEPLMRRALAIDEASYGPEHPAVARDLNNLASLLQATNRLGEAEPLMRWVLLIFLAFQRSTEHVHPHLKQACANYMAILRAMDLSDEEVGRRLLSLGEDAGFDAGTYQSLLAGC